MRLSELNSQSTYLVTPDAFSQSQKLELYYFMEKKNSRQLNT